MTSHHDGAANADDHILIDSAFVGQTGDVGKCDSPAASEKG